MRSFTKRVYCSSANIGSGYDTFGICHNAFYNDITISQLDENGKFSIECEVNNKVDPRRNSALHVVEKFAEKYEITGKFSMLINSTIPTGMGLGSSGSASVGAILSFSKALDIDLDQESIIQYASLGEEFASGSRHLDNVAASTLGNFTAVLCHKPIIAKSFPLCSGINFLIIIPQLFSENKTMENRRLIPETVKVNETVGNVRYASSLMAGLVSNDMELIRFGLNDKIFERARSRKYPFFYDLRKICLKNEALGLVMSGSGPTMLCFMDEKTDVLNLRRQIDAYFLTIKLNYITSISYPSEGVL